MKNFWQENKITIIAFCITMGAMLVATYFFVVTGGLNFALFIVQIISAISFLYWLRKLATALVKRIAIGKRIKNSRLAKLLMRLVDAVVKMSGKATGKVGGFFSRLIPTGNPILKLYSDERSLISFRSDNLGSKLRKMRWRSLEDNRQRVRFCYIAYIRKQLKLGARISTADTPNELYNKLSTTDSNPDKNLFDLYNLARYNENSEITAQQVESVRK